MIFHPDFREEPYWWRAAAPQDTRPQPLPRSADVVIVGSGVCGLSAAIEAAKRGAEVVVIDAHALGSGASTRSGGMLTASPKAVLYAAGPGTGAERQSTLVTEANATLSFLKELVAAEGLDADLQICGRFYGAFSGHHLPEMRRRARLLADRTGLTVRIIEPEEQHEEVRSDYFHGGYVVEEYGGVHPAKLTRSLSARARAVGVGLHSHAQALNVERRRAGHEVFTPRGRIRAGRVLFATNGYTDRASRWAYQRVLPVASYQIATEPLPAGLMSALIPRRRMISDSRRDLLYMRPAPDGRCLIFGCRPRSYDRDATSMARHLHARLVRVFPEVEPFRIINAWSGFVGMTRDGFPHIAQHDGVFYALGCNGSGIALMSWLGCQAARTLLSDAPVPALADRPLRKIPLRSAGTGLVALATLGCHVRDFASRPAEVLAERLRLTLKQVDPTEGRRKALP
jgi:gamma-glutamylputrescine oxidase